MASLNAMSACLADQEKSRKPALTLADTIKHLCFLNGARTDFIIESIRDKKTEEIKNSSDIENAKKDFYFVIDAMSHDKLFQENQIKEEELNFCSRFYKADQEPTY